MNAIQCVSVTIRGDDIIEDTESFTVTFLSDDERDEIVNASTVVSIVDDDGTCNVWILTIVAIV